jgi:hypothetical protein
MTAPAEASAAAGPAAASPRRATPRAPLGVRAWSWVLDQDRWATGVVLLAYAAVVAAGATTSSIGIGHLRQDPANPLGRQWGTPRWIRSDEYNVYTPIDLSTMATGGAPTLSPLGADASLTHRFANGGFFETVTFFDSTLLRLATFLPERSLFAAHWWLPVLLLLVFLPRWFVQVGLSRRLGWVAAILIVLAPSSAWWSLMPVHQIAYTVTGCSLLLSAVSAWRRRSYLLMALWAVGGGILIAGMPSFYAPWSIVLGVPVLLATVAYVLVTGTRWSDRLVPLGATGVVAALFGIGTLWENREGIAALTQTVYPGARRSAAAPQSIDFLLGAPGLSELQNADPVGTNASELSTAYTICFLWAVLLVVAASTRLTSAQRAVVWTLGGLGSAWLAWTMLSLGTVGERIPLFNLVTPPRAAQVVGVLGILLVAALLSARGPASLRTAAWAAATCGLVSAYAVALLRTTALPTSRLAVSLLAGLLVAGVVLVVSRWGERAWVLVVVAVVAALPVARANPLIVGFGDLRDSETARYLYEAGATARERGELWVSDVGSLDVVMLANGVPSLSGFQRSGPDVGAWERLDPDHDFEEAWNRGGGYVPFSFAEGEPTEIATDGFDVTFVKTDPCVVADEFPVSHVVSAQDLSGSCLERVDGIVWSGSELNVYEIRG